MTVKELIDHLEEKYVEKGYGNLDVGITTAAGVFTFDEDDDYHYKSHNMIILANID